MTGHLSIGNTLQETGRQAFAQRKQAAGVGVKLTLRQIQSVSHAHDVRHVFRPRSPTSFLVTARLQRL
jgi:hypothetical protein